MAHPATAGRRLRIAWAAGLTLLVLALLPSPASAATVRAENRIDTWTLDVAIGSPSIDAVVKWVRLLLPTGWSKTSTKTWPTIWMLHGGTDDHKSWSDKSNVKTLAKATDAIVVLPETSWCSAYSDWRDGSVRWETYLTTEVDAVLRGSYRANATRAVAGNSMGGLGALKLAANHPGFFRGAAAFSGNVDPLHSSDPDHVKDPLLAFDRPGLGCAADWRRVWGDPAIPAQRDIWVRNDPYDQAAGLLGLKELFLSAGIDTGDIVEKRVSWQTQAVEAKVRGLKTLTDPVVVSSHYQPGGTHGWTDWTRELTTAWPKLKRSIGLVP